MKKLFVFMMLLFAASYSFADYIGTVTTNQNELSFTTNNGYNVVALKNGFFTSEIGAPQLPVKILRFVIPIDKKVSGITISNTTIQQLSGTYNIYPVQTPVPTNLLPNSSPFDDPNSAIYNSNTPYPNKLYEIIDDGYPMGYHVITIKFYPVEYIPANRTLNLYTNINFTIAYENNTENILIPNKQSKYSNDLSKGRLKSLVSNFNDLTIVSGGAREVVNNGTSVSNTKGMNPVSLTYIPDYIIITNISLKSSFQTLANWKTQKGVYTMVVAVEDIYANYSGFDNAEKIRNYLKDVYVNFGSSYILIGGDVDIVPTRFSPIYSGNFETDFYYATVQGNWNANGNNIIGENPEYINGNFVEIDNIDASPVFRVGRAPIHTVEEANVFVSKVMGYEKLNNTLNKNYVQNLSFWGADGAGICHDWPSDISSLNTIDNSNSGYIKPVNYYVLKLYDNFSNHYGESLYHDRYFQLNKTNVLNSLNNGCE